MDQYDTDATLRGAFNRVGQLEDRIDGLLKANNANVEKRRNLAAMLRKCQAQFEFYANQHWAKDTPESNKKAEVNADFAAQIVAALRENGPE